MSYLLFLMVATMRHSLRKLPGLPDDIHPNAKRFEVKYKKYSPAMLEGFTDRCLTLEELLAWRVPK